MSILTERGLLIVPTPKLAIPSSVDAGGVSLPLMMKSWAMAPEQARSEADRARIHLMDMYSLATRRIHPTPGRSQCKNSSIRRSEDTRQVTVMAILSAGSGLDRQAL